MKARHQKFIAALTALALIAGGIGAVSAAPGSIDSTATDSEEITYVSDGETISTSFNGSLGPSEKYGIPVLNATGASADDLAVNVTHDGVEYYRYTGEWDTYNSGESDTSTDYIHNASESDLKNIPVEPNSNTTFTINYWNESKDPANQTPTNITVYVETTDERNVQRVSSDSAFTDVETTESPFYRPLSEDYNSTTVDDSPAINGSNTTVIYHLADSDVQDPFQNSTEELESTGAFTLMMADAGDENVPVFYRSAPDWYDQSEMGTYAVYEPGEDRVSFYLAEGFDGETSADITASSDVYRATDAYTVWNLAGGYSGAGPSAVMNMVM